MERYTALGVLLFALLAIAVALLFPPEHQVPSDDHLPWQIEPSENGSISVFGITLGETTLAETVARFEEDVEISMFVAADEQKMAVEAFFESTAMGGLRAKLVTTLAFTPERLKAIYARGVRIATLGSGTRKVTLASEDIRLAYQTPIATLSYLPRANLAPELLEGRFGSPAERIPDGDTVHWLYPDKGLDIIFSEKGKEVFEYFPPRDYPRLRERLQAKPQQNNP